jgi:hypothetical protein
MGWKVIQFLTNFPLSEEEEFKMLVVTYQAPFDNGSVWDSNTPTQRKPGEIFFHNLILNIAARKPRMQLFSLQRSVVTDRWIFQNHEMPHLKLYQEKVSRPGWRLVRQTSLVLPFPMWWWKHGVL